MNAERPLARLFASCAILILGALASTRLPLSFEPATLFPELRLLLTVASESTDENLLRSPRLTLLENVLRRSGDVEHLAGEIDAHTANLRIRYAPGTDTDAKAALLDSLLGEMRRDLPAGSLLTVHPSRQRGGAFAFVVQVPFADSNLLAAVLRLPGVAAARYTGNRESELRIELPPAAGSSEAAIDAHSLTALLTARRFGPWPGPGGIEVEAAPLEFEKLWVGPSQIGQHALLSAHPGETNLAARVDGNPAELLVIDRDPQASPLALKIAIDNVLSEAGYVGGRFLRDESVPLRLLLRRLALGFAVALGLFAALGLLLHSLRTGAWRLLSLPVGLAAAFAVLHLAGESLDVLTLPVLLLAILLAPLPAALSRGGNAWGWLLLAVAAAASLPIALALLGELGVFLGSPARVFVLAFAAATAAQWLLPPADPPRRGVLGLARRLQNLSRRQAAGSLLATVVLVYLSWIFFADSLWPRAGTLHADLGDLALTLSLPASSQLATTAQEVERTEKVLSGLPGLERHFVLYGPSFATFFIDMEPEWKTRPALLRSAEAIEGKLRPLGLIGRVQVLGRADQAPPLRLDRGEEFRAETDPATRTYRILLRSRDFGSLIEAEAAMHGRLEKYAFGYKRSRLVPDWRPPEKALELRARPGVDSALVHRARKVLDEAFRQDTRVSLGRLPGQSHPIHLRLFAPGRSLQPLQTPRLEEVRRFLRQVDGDLLRHFELVETFDAPSLYWESGLFVLPLDVEIEAPPLQWLEARSSLHHSFRHGPQPFGVALELPSLENEPWEERLQMMAALVLLPLLLLALLALRLDSFWLALVALLPGVGALAAVAPLLAFQAGGNDEATMLALAASLTGLLPLAAYSTSVGRARAIHPEAAFDLWATRGHRELSRVLPKVLPWLAAAALVLFFTGFGLDPARQPWVKPLRVAGLSLFAGGLLALFVLPALQVATERTLRSLRREERQRRREVADPPAWREEPGLNVLEVRSLSKRYSNGFRALRKVDLRLEPGIVALLGPNGAGKTTLLRTLCGTLEPSRGQVLFRGKPVLPENLPAYRRRVGYLPQSFNAWDGLSAWRFLEYWSDVLGLPGGEDRHADIDKALRSVGLEKMAKHAVRELSGGQRRRLGIARALLGEPPILIVDEPTTGLDVDARNQLRETLVALAGDRIVIFSTHIASDIAAVAKRVLLLNRGSLLFDGSPADLIVEARGRVFERLLREDELRTMRRNYQITTRIREPEGIRIRAVTHAGQEAAGDLVEPNLEEAYLARLGQGVRQRDESSWASLLDLESWRSR